MCLATASGTVNAFIYIMTLKELTTLEKLNNAFYECSKVSYWKESTQRYKANLLMNNLRLQADLRSGQYRTSPTTDFIINERGKIRQINAPALRDRIIQKVLCQQILIPRLTKSLIYDNYASLKGRGTSFARKRIDVLLHKFLRKHGNDGYVLQIDIRKYFDSIDHSVLKKMVHEHIHEPQEIMDLIDYVIDTSSDGDKGLNLGAEAPQIFAIYYLAGLDNYIKSVKGIKYYGRYMDDIFIFAKTKEQLINLLEDIKKQLADVKLLVNDRKTHIIPLRHGFTFLQVKYNIVDQKVIRRPTRAKIIRERRRLKRFRKKWEQNIMGDLDVSNAYKSWRNAVLKECPQSKRTVYQMNKLFCETFPNIKKYICPSRERLVKEILKDKEVLQCIA